MANREIDAKDAAIAPAHDVGFGILQYVEQRHDVIRHQVVAVRTRIARAPTVTATVHQDHRMMRRHGWTWLPQ